MVPRNLQLAKPACVSPVFPSHLHGDSSFLSKVLDWRGQGCPQYRSNSFGSYSHTVNTPMPWWPLRHSSSCKSCPQTVFMGFLRRQRKMVVSQQNYRKGPRVIVEWYLVLVCASVQSRRNNDVLNRVLMPTVWRLGPLLSVISHASPLFL